MNLTKMMCQLAAVPLLAGLAITVSATGIVHDAEYVKTYNQYKAEWDKEDNDLK